MCVSMYYIFVRNVHAKRVDHAEKKQAKYKGLRKD